MSFIRVDQEVCKAPWFGELEFDSNFRLKARALRTVASEYRFAGVIIAFPGFAIPFLFGSWDF